MNPVPRAMSPNSAASFVPDRTETKTVFAADFTSGSAPVKAGTERKDFEPDTPMYWSKKARGKRLFTQW